MLLTEFNEELFAKTMKEKSEVLLCKANQNEIRSRVYEAC